MNGRLLWAVSMGAAVGMTLGCMDDGVLDGLVLLGGVSVGSLEGDLLAVGIVLRNAVGVEVDAAEGLFVDATTIDGFVLGCFEGRHVGDLVVGIAVGTLTEGVVVNFTVDVGLTDCPRTSMAIHANKQIAAAANISIIISIF